MTPQVYGPCGPMLVSLLHMPSPLNSYTPLHPPAFVAGRCFGRPRLLNSTSVSAEPTPPPRSTTVKFPSAAYMDHLPHVKQHGLGFVQATDEDTPSPFPTPPYERASRGSALPVHTPASGNGTPTLGRRPGAMPHGCTGPSSRGTLSRMLSPANFLTRCAPPPPATCPPACPVPLP